MASGQVGVVVLKIVARACRLGAEVVVIAAFSQSLGHATARLAPAASGGDGLLAPESVEEVNRRGLGVEVVATL